MISTILKTLITKEVKRVLNVYNQTLIAPVINALIFFAIFTVVFSDRQSVVLNYDVFVASGIIVMSIMQNSYSNTQSSMTTSKVLGFAVDTALPPIPTHILLTGFVAGGVIRGLSVGLIITTLFCFFVKLPFFHIFTLMIYAILASILFSLIGVLVGSVSTNFDSSVSYNTYFITPITMLSCTFYSIKMLPPLWQKITLINPVFYIVDSFRFAMMGSMDSPFPFFIQIVVLFVWILILAGASHYFLKTKYHEIR